MAVRIVRQDGTGSTLVNNTTSVVNSNNVGDMPTTVNAILAALKAHGLINTT